MSYSPTPGLLFPEAHPDPTAGGALGWVPVDDPRPLWDHPLANPDLFEVAHFLVSKGLSDEDINEYRGAVLRSSGLVLTACHMARRGDERR